jgi:hypothetical protein
VVEAGMRVAWFTLEGLGAIVRRHRVDDTITKVVGRIVRSDLIVVDLCRYRDYADTDLAPVVKGPSLRALSLSPRDDCRHSPSPDC